MLSTNQVLNQGRYRIIHHVGPSDTSGLYQAYDTVSDTNVVLKERQGTAGKAATPAQLESVNNAFANKAKSMTEIDHESLLNVRDYFSELDRQYLVIESVDGQDLAELLSGDGSPIFSDVVKWADHLLGALEYLHTHRPPILHGDIKPENIRLTSDFIIKLLSPGITRGDEFSSAMDDTASLPYRSLEQLWESLDAASRKVIANSFDEESEEILREEPDERSDLYSLAATIYHAMTKVAPADAMARTLEVLDGNPDPMQSAHEIDGDISQALSDVLMKALEIKRENRFDSASEMHAAFKSAAADILNADKNNAAAEQKRFETERQAAEAQKLEQEAAQKRLENERVKAEKRIKHEAEQKQKAEEQAAKSKSPIQKDDLLELPEGANLSAVQELDGADVLADAFVEEPAPKAARAAAASSNYSPTFYEAETSGGSMSKMPIMIGAAVVLLMVIIGGWMFMGSSGGAQPTPAQTTPSTDAAKTAPATEQAAQTAPAAAVPEPAATTAPQTAATTDQIQKNDAAKAKEKARKEEKAQTAKPAATPKKAVTVDDIINDN